jgi:hypothetical protein
MEQVMITAVISLLHIALATGMGWFLERRWGLLPALACGAWMACSCGAAGYWLLLSASETSLSWKNYVAGWLIPWGYGLAPQSLASVAGISTLVWTMLVGLGAMAAFFSNSTAAAGTPRATPSTLLSLLLLGAWVLHGGSLLYLLEHLSQQPAITKPPGSTMAITAALIFLAFLASLGCRYSVMPRLALLIAGGPILLVAILYTLLALLILLGGSSSRWN